MMKKETIKRIVRDQIPGAEYYREDEKCIWYVVGIVTSYQLKWARLPYVQVLPRDSSTLYLVIYREF